MSQIKFDSVKVEIVDQMADPAHRSSASWEEVWEPGFISQEEMHGNTIAKVVHMLWGDLQSARVLALAVLSVYEDGAPSGVSDRDAAFIDAACAYAEKERERMERNRT